MMMRYFPAQAILDPLEWEALVAAEAARQFAEMPTEQRLKIRRAYAEKRECIPANVILILFGLWLAIYCPITWVAITGLLVTIAYSALLVRKCSYLRLASRAGIKPYRPGTVPVSQALTQLSQN